MRAQQYIVRPETTDQLGRVIPAITLADVMSRDASPRHVQECLAIAAQYGRDREYNEIVRWAASHGVTHGPADLAGHRCRFALIEEVSR
jgi:two-component SAPR family response regulator